jgi:hypothetical protein
VIELRFDERLYDGFAVDEAAKTFEPFADITREREGGAWVLRVTLRDEAAGDGHTEDEVASELANYALGKTIERKGTAS